MGAAGPTGGGRFSEPSAYHRVSPERHRPVSAFGLQHGLVSGLELVPLRTLSGLGALVERDPLKSVAPPVSVGQGMQKA